MKILTIVTPSYEGHAVQFGRLLESIDSFCTDAERLVVKVVVERRNLHLFRGIVGASRIKVDIEITERALAGFGVNVPAATFLKRIGKFTFQTLKKLHALRHATTKWSLVLDSETLFVNPFSVADLVRDYSARKYVFYSRTASRGKDWDESLGKSVTERCARVIASVASDRWYMEFFHWFYETEKVHALIESGLGNEFWRDIRDESRGEVHFFEPVLYYQYLEKKHGDEYEFLDIFDVLRAQLPSEIAARFVLSELPFSRFGNEYLLNLLAPEEVHFLAPIFEHYRLAFLRLEPPMLCSGYHDVVRRLPHFAAFISSQHLTWLRKPMAVCVSGAFSEDIWTAHDQLRQIVGFLSAVECEIYVCCNADTDQHGVVKALAPKAHLFLQREESRTEARTPTGSAYQPRTTLWDLRAAEDCFALIEDPARYGYIAHVTPGLFWDVSLKEIMIAISDNSDVLPDAVYVPRAMHGRGLNTRIALGTPAVMAVYLRAYSGQQHRTGAADPQHMLLTQIIRHKLKIVLAEMAYSDVCEAKASINVTHAQFHRQFSSAWGDNEDMSMYEDVTDKFASRIVNDSRP